MTAAAVDQHRLDVGDGDQQPGNERPEQGAEALDRLEVAALGGNQLARRSRQ